MSTALRESSYEPRPDPDPEPGSAEAAFDAVVDRIERGDQAAEVIPFRRDDDTEAYIDRVLDRAVGNEPRKSRQRADSFQRGRPAKKLTPEEALDRWVDKNEPADDDEPRAERSAKHQQVAALPIAEVNRRAAMLTDAQVAAQRAATMLNLAQQDVAAGRDIRHLVHHVDHAIALADAKRTEAFNYLAAVEDEAFAANNPDANDELRDASIQVLVDAGLDGGAINQLWNGIGGVPLNDERVRSALIDIVRHRTGKKLELVSDATPAVQEYLIDLGFGENEIIAMINGALISLRDHRVQQALSDYARIRMRTK